MLYREIQLRWGIGRGYAGGREAARDNRDTRNRNKPKQPASSTALGSSECSVTYLSMVNRVYRDPLIIHESLHCIQVPTVRCHEEARQIRVHGADRVLTDTSWDVYLIIEVS